MAPDKTILNTASFYCHIFTLEKAGTTVNYHSIFIRLAPGEMSIDIMTVETDMK
jgi:hypothetical protein